MISVYGSDLLHPIDLKIGVGCGVEFGVVFARVRSERSLERERENVK